MRQADAYAGIGSCGREIAEGIGRVRGDMVGGPRMIIDEDVLRRAEVWLGLWGGRLALRPRGESCFKAHFAIFGAEGFPFAGCMEELPADCWRKG